MTFVGRGVFRLAGLALLISAVPACAQDNLDRGKSAQQLFASDCSICHKSPQGLAKGGGSLFGLQGFLREHYTASRETAALLARYLEAAGEPPAADPKKQPRRAGKPSDSKPSDSKPADAKPAETKSSDGKPADQKAADKPDVKPEAKPEVKPEVKPEPKTEAKPEPKPEPKESSDIKSGIAVSPAPAEQPKSE